MGFFKKLFGGGPEYDIILGLDDFEPQNSFEQTLKALNQGEIDMPAMISVAISAKVFLPSADQPEYLKNRKGFRPLVFEYPGVGPMIAVFTDFNRLHPVQALFSPVHSGLEVEFTWVVQSAPEEVGIVLNPGWEVGLVIPAEGVEQLRGEIEQSRNSRT